MVSLKVSYFPTKITMGKPYGLKTFAFGCIDQCPLADRGPLTGIGISKGLIE